MSQPSLTVLEFFQKNWVYRMKEKSVMHLAKLWLELCIAIRSFWFLTKLFFFTFFKPDFFWISIFWTLGFWPNFFFSLFSNLIFFFWISVFWTYQVDFNGFGSYFYQLWYVFNQQKQVLGLFFHDFRPFFSLFCLDLFWVQNRLSEAGI